jgi:hypothetical protein
MTMPLSVKEAVSIWIERAKGLKIREICAKHDIDPRRVYEVFEGRVHPASLGQAREELKRIAPALALKLHHHKPSRKVIKVPTTTQRDLFT